MADVDIPQLLNELRAIESSNSDLVTHERESITKAIELIETRLEPEWISVEDRLPELSKGAVEWWQGVRVLAVLECPETYGGPFVQEVMFTPHGKWLVNEERGLYARPTHWRPMPTFVKPEKDVVNG